MDVAEVFEELKRRAAKDPAVLAALLSTEASDAPLRDFCAYSTSLGLPLYEMDILQYGEESYAAMKRSTNGGGENSPLLDGQDDFYGMFMAELRSLR